jgi:hypothetical protein
MSGGLLLTPATAAVLASMLAAILGLVGFIVQLVLKGELITKSAHKRELDREHATGETWRKAYFTEHEVTVLLTRHLETLEAGARVTARVLSALPVPEPPEPPESGRGTPDAPVAA